MTSAKPLNFPDPWSLHLKGEDNGNAHLIGFLSEEMAGGGEALDRPLSVNLLLLQCVWGCGVYHYPLWR